MIFQDQIKNLATEIQAFERLIASRREQIAKLQQAENIADGALGQVLAAVQALQPLGPDAIAQLKGSVLSLFDGGTDNPPTEPRDNGDSPDDGGSTPLGDGGGSDCGESVAPESYNPMEAAGEPEEVVTNLENCDEMADEDDIEFAASEEVQPTAQHTELVYLSHCIAYLKLASTGEVLATYIGFKNKQLLNAWKRYLEPIAHQIQIREPLRLCTSRDIKWELKLVGLGLSRTNQLVDREFGKLPPQSQPKKAPPARPVFEPGDIVQSELVPDWTYEVLEVEPDGELQVKRVGVPAAPVERRSSWSVVLIGKKKPTNLHSFSLKTRQVEQLAAIANMFEGLGYLLVDGENCISSPNWVVRKGKKKVGDLYYLACSWELQALSRELEMDADGFLELLVDWGCITDSEARGEGEAA